MASSDNHFAFFHFFFFGMVWSPPPVQCYKPPPIVLQALLLSYLFIYLFIYVSISLSICVFMYVHIYRGPPWWLSGKEFAWRRWQFSLWVEKISWRRKCNPLQYSCLGNQGTEKSDQLQSTGSQRIRHNLEAKPPLPPLLVYFIYLSIYVSMYVCIYLSISIRWVCIYLFNVSVKLNFYSALFLAPGILFAL